MISAPTGAPVPETRRTMTSPAPLRKSVHTTQNPPLTGSNATLAASCTPGASQITNLAPIKAPLVATRWA